MTSTWLLSSRASETHWLKHDRFVIVDLLFTNPCWNGVIKLLTEKKIRLWITESNIFEKLQRTQIGRYLLITLYEYRSNLLLCLWASFQIRGKDNRRYLKESKDWNYIKTFLTDRLMDFDFESVKCGECLATLIGMELDSFEVVVEKCPRAVCSALETWNKIHNDLPFIIYP